MRNIVVGLVMIMLITITGCSMGGNVGLVKRTKNQSGLKCANIPKIIEARMGFKVQSAKWIEEVEDGFSKVALIIEAKKTNKSGPVYMSYKWNPKWKWSVEKSTRSVIPVNKLAKEWMRGII